MAKVKFNKPFFDSEKDERVGANEPVEMTLKRADEIVEKVRKQSDKFEGYADFSYERVDKPKEDKSTEEAPKEDEEEPEE